MSFDEHVTEFAGFPVVDYDPSRGVYQKPLEAGSLLGALAAALRADPEDRVSRMALTDYLSEQGEQPYPTAFRVNGQEGGHLERLLQDPFVGLVQALVIACYVDPSDDAEALDNARDRIPNLRALFLGDTTWEEGELSWLQLPDLTDLLTTFPQLEHFRSRGALGLRPFEHSNLRSLTLEASNLSREVVRAVGASTLPQLDHLEIWLGTSQYGADTQVEDLAGILEGRGLPALRTLSLRNSEISDDVAEALMGAPILERLKVLDLSLGTPGDRGARALLASPTVARLERLDIHHHYVSPELVERLRGLGIEVETEGEPKVDDPDGRRYVAHAE